jgi:RNA polymerase sigma-70 factor, ECF subfamily
MSIGAATPDFADLLNVGDAAELEHWFGELRQPVARYLSALGLSQQDGEEVLQEVFLALLRHLRQDRPRQNLRGWIFRVAHNLGLKQRQRGQARLLPSLGLEHHPLDPAPSPEQQVVSRQRQQTLWNVVAALSEQDRQCLFLRAEGLRYREIAEVLEMSLGAVAASLARSLGKLAHADRRFMEGR